MDLFNKFLQWLTVIDVKKLASMLYYEQLTNFKIQEAEQTTEYHDLLHTWKLILSIKSNLNYRTRSTYAVQVIPTWTRIALILEQSACTTA